MTEQAQAFDPAAVSEQVYGIGDTVSDPQQTATALRALADRLAGGGQYSGAAGESGQSFLMPEATPRMAPEQPASLQQLHQRLPELERAVHSADPATAADLLDGFVSEVNASLDVAGGLTPAGRGPPGRPRRPAPSAAAQHQRGAGGAPSEGRRDVARPDRPFGG